MKERDRDPVSQLPCDKRAFHRLRCCNGTARGAELPTFFPAWVLEEPESGRRRKGRRGITDLHPLPHHRLADLSRADLEEMKGLG